MENGIIINGISYVAEYNLLGDCVGCCFFNKPQCSNICNAFYQLTGIMYMFRKKVEVTK